MPKQESSIKENFMKANLGPFQSDHLQQTQTNAPTIDIINQSTVIKDNDVDRLTTAMKYQIYRDWFKWYGGYAIPNFIPSGKSPDPSHWWVVILDDSDQAQAAGYHDLTDKGYPIGKVFARSDMQAGMDWGITTSHEILEMIGDPYLISTLEVPQPDGTSWWFANEVCDACESDQYGYAAVANIKVSDFVTPFFWRFWGNNPRVYDHMGHITQPLTVLKGGYLSVYKNGQWTQTSNFKDIKGNARQKAEYKAIPHVGSRRERRERLHKYGPEKMIKSTVLSRR